uniref:Uncharacterized protein n=1 Tax=Kuenenia stuttgartiensis TaxID=174633 RepID=Q1PVJ5_KUEST|nr:unknown protein [Candidatus Kuenenia stuttgartiensis]
MIFDCRLWKAFIYIAPTFLIRHSQKLNKHENNLQSSILNLQFDDDRLLTTEGTIKHFAKKHALTNGSVQRNYQ